MKWQKWKCLHSTHKTIFYPFCHSTCMSLPCAVISLYGIEKQFIIPFSVCLELFFAFRRNWKIEKFWLLIWVVFHHFSFLPDISFSFLFFQFLFNYCMRIKLKNFKEKLFGIQNEIWSQFKCVLLAFFANPF